MVKKNCMALGNLDYYSDSVSLTMNGKKYHQTRLGGCLTIMLGLTVLLYFMWGTLKVFNRAEPVIF